MKKIVALAVIAIAITHQVGARDTAIYNGKLTSGLNANGMAITNLPTPVAYGDAATKGYVDGIGGVTPQVVTNISEAVVSADHNSAAFSNAVIRVSPPADLTPAYSYTTAVSNKLEQDIAAISADKITDGTNTLSANLSFQMSGAIPYTPPHSSYWLDTETGILFTGSDGSWDAPEVAEPRIRGFIRYYDGSEEGMQSWEVRTQDAPSYTPEYFFEAPATTNSIVNCRFIRMMNGTINTKVATTNEIASIATAIATPIASSAASSAVTSYATDSGATFAGAAANASGMASGLISIQNEGGAWTLIDLYGEWAYRSGVIAIRSEIPTDSTVSGWGYIKSYTETDPESLHLAATNAFASGIVATADANAAAIVDGVMEYALTNIAANTETFALASGVIGNLALDSSHTNINLTLVYPTDTAKAADILLRVICAAKTGLAIASVDTDVDGTEWAKIAAGTNYVTATRTAYEGGRSKVLVNVKEVK